MASGFSSFSVTNNSATRAAPQAHQMEEKGSLPRSLGAKAKAHTKGTGKGHVRPSGEAGLPAGAGPSGCTHRAAPAASPSSLQTAPLRTAPQPVHTDWLENLACKGFERYAPVLQEASCNGWGTASGHRSFQIPILQLPAAVT